MATTCQSVVDQAIEILQDSGNDHWSDAELFAWLKYGQKAIVRLKPTANPVLGDITLASGLWQDLNSGAIFLLDVIMNSGTDGSTPGAPVTIVERKWIDRMLPDWTTETAAATIKHVIYDPKVNPKKFMVYPKSDGTTRIEVMEAHLPTDPAAIGNNITLDDEYVEALLEYILFRAFTRDADYVKNQERAMFHYMNFKEIVVGHDDKEDETNPKKRYEGRERG